MKDVNEVIIDGTGITVKKLDKTRKSGRDLQALADALDICPFEILLHVAAGNSEKLGLTEVIPLGDRIQAAKEAAQYLHPKKRAIEVSGSEEAPLNLNLNTEDIVELIKAARG